MRRWLPLTFLLVACGPSGGQEDHLADSGATSKPISSTEPPPVTPSPGVKLGTNPSRTHQLDSLQKADVNLKGNTVHLWVMDDDSKRQEGMMFLTDAEVKSDEGMLFKFEEPQLKADGHGFWMHNTLIPLDIVYLSPSGQVLNVGHGKVENDDQVVAEGDYQNVIELKAGMAAKYGLKAGDRIDLPKP